MSEQIRDVTSITFSGPRFNDVGLELDVLPELLVYRNLLIEMAERLWRAERRSLRRLPKGFRHSIRLRSYTFENNGSVEVSLKRVVDASEMISTAFDEPDEIDDAAQKIDETIEAMSRDAALLEPIAKPVLALLARFGATLRPDETMRSQSARSLRPVELTHGVRERLRSLVKGGLHGNAIPGRVTSIPPKFYPEPTIGGTHMLSDAVLQPQPAGHVGSYDSSARPIWETLTELGDNVPAEAWDRVPADLSTNLDHYLYDKPEQT